MKEKKVYNVAGSDSEKIKALEAELSKVKAELESQIDGTSRLVADCDGWREKYRSLVEKCDKLKIAHTTLEQSYKLMEEELEEVRNANIQLGRLNASLSRDTQSMKVRGFWRKIFNY